MRPLLHIVEPQQQTYQGRLAGSGMPDHRNCFAFSDAETDIAKYPVLAVVREPDVVEFKVLARAGMASGEPAT